MACARNRIIVLMTEDELAAVEDYRFAERIPSRGEAIRDLIVCGLDAKAAQAMNRGAPARRPRKVS